MRILITGSEGSLMQALIPKLLQEGHTIIGIDNLYRYGVRSPSAGINYEFYEQDLLSADKVIKIIKDVDVVIHAAAKLYGVLGLLNYRADILGDEVTVARNVLNACVQNNISHIVYMSSSMVYDACPQDIAVPLIESMPFEYPYPNTDYGLGKLVTERLCEAYRQQYGISYTIWRPFNIVSPHEAPMTDQGFSHVIPDFINNIIKNKLNPLPIIGDGNQIRCFTWIDDVVDIIIKCSFDSHAKNQTFNVCNVEPTTMREMANMIYQIAFKTDAELEFITSKNYQHDVKVRVPSIAKLETTFGNFKFTPTRETVQQCLRKVL
jgi:UDP-glucose 4-epimerase